MQVNRGAIAAGRGHEVAARRVSSHDSSCCGLLSVITFAVVQSAAVKAGVAVPGGTGAAATLAAGKTVLLDATSRVWAEVTGGAVPKTREAYIVITDIAGAFTYRFRYRSLQAEERKQGLRCRRSQ